MPDQAVLFPSPVVIAGRNFWFLGKIRRYVAAMAGEPEPAARPDDEHLLTTKQVRERLGGVSDMWIHRRRQKASAALPKRRRAGKEPAAERPPA